MSDARPSQATLTADGLAVQCLALARVPGLLHGTTTRAALPAPGKPALPAAVLECRERGVLPALPAAGAHQVHEAAIGWVDRPASQWDRLENFEWTPQAQTGEFHATDALMTRQREIMLIIQTADCLPVLLVDPVQGWLGAAHCGWRSALAGLAGQLAQAMTAQGAVASQMLAWLGPCIQAPNYEVGRELVARFEAAFPGAPVSPNGMHLDLCAAVRHQLRAAGVGADHIFDSGQCTLAYPERYHSYRREGDRSGRMLTFAGWTEPA